jgi:hypothetical protein
MNTVTTTESQNSPGSPDNLKVPPDKGSMRD